MSVTNKIFNLVVVQFITALFLFSPNAAQAELKIYFGNSAYQHSHHSHYNSVFNNYKPRIYRNKYYYNPYSSYRYNHQLYSNKYRFSYRNNSHYYGNSYYHPYSSHHNQYQQAYEKGFHDGHHQQHKKRTYKLGK